MKNIQMSKPGIRVHIFILTVMSCTVHASRRNISHYSLMQNTIIISEEYFSVGPPLGIVLPLAAKDYPCEEVEYLLEELHTSGLWPIVVYNVSSNVKGNTYSEKEKHGAYIILISAPCEEWKDFISRFQQQVYEVSADNSTWYSFNPRAKFIISIMSNCEQKENREISRAILSELLMKEVLSAIVLFPNFNEHESNDLHGSITDSVQSTYLEMHTFDRYENAQKCNANQGNLPVKVYTMQKFDDIKRRDIFQNYHNKNFHKCQIRVQAFTAPPFVNHPKLASNNESRYEELHEGGWEIELLGVVKNALNMSLDIEIRNLNDYSKSFPDIYVGGIIALPSKKFNMIEITRNFFTWTSAWYTPCAVQKQRLSRFFEIFSVDVWLCFVLSLVFAIITVRFISNFTQKSHLHQSKSYTNIFSVTSNIISVVLSVSVNSQPRSAPLRLFFICWVCFSVAISTIFQAYFTTYLIEPGYEEPIRTVQQMLKSEKKFGFMIGYERLFQETSESVNLAIFKNAVRCPDGDECLMWSTLHQNISIILDDMGVEKLREIGKWSDENNRPLLCTLEDGVVRTYGFVFLVRKGRRLLEHINDVIVRVVEGGIFTHIKKRALFKQDVQSKFNSASFADTYTTISMRHLQTPFYLFLIGNIFAIVCFTIELLWHRYRSKGRGPNCTSLCHRQA